MLASGMIAVPVMTCSTMPTSHAATPHEQEQAHRASKKYPVLGQPFHLALLVSSETLNTAIHPGVTRFCCG